ncbi:MAG: hypothetical protein WA609_18620 [Terriglobales bacterium]
MSSPLAAPAQTLASRLILKDGTYQPITKYEVKGDRVRYFSAERGEWEEVPNALVDWDATNKYEEGRLTGGPIPEAAELDKEIDAQRKAALARSPEVAPRLRLSDEGGVYLLDTYQNEPELVEIQQSGSDVNRSTKANILRAAINPFSGSKQTIELPGPHAKVQAHTPTPSLYVNISADTAEGPPAVASGAEEVGRPAANTPSDTPALPPTEAFKIIRVESKGGKRVAGALKVGVTGKMKTDERFIPATVTSMTGGWIKITPIDPLPSGEYAVAEMLGKDSINLYVWDFGVNPNAPANAFALKPEAPEPATNDAPKELQKREKQ